MPHKTDHTLQMRGNRVLVQHVGYADYEFSHDELITEISLVGEPRKTVLRRAMKFLELHLIHTEGDGNE